MKKNIIVFNSIVICIFPILSIYKSFLPGFSLGDLTLLLGTILIILMNLTCDKSKKIINGKPQIYLILIFFIYFMFSLIDYFYNDDISSTIFLFQRLIRTLFYVFVSCVFANNIDFKIVTKMLKIIGIISSIFVILQFMLYYLFNVNIYFVARNFIYSNNVYDKNYYDLIVASKFVRCAGFFLEPSHFCQYACISLVFLLSSKMNKKNIISLLICEVAIILSTSWIGIILSVILFFIYFINNVINNGVINLKKFLVLIVILLLLVIIFYFEKDFALVKYTIARINGLFEGNSAAYTSRMISYRYFFVKTNDILILLFGNGWGNSIEGTFYASFSYVLSCCGIIGLIMIFVYYLYYLIKFRKKLVFNLFMISLIYLQLTTEVITNYWYVFFMCLLFELYNENKKLLHNV